MLSYEKDIVEKWHWKDCQLDLFDWFKGKKNVFSKILGIKVRRYDIRRL